jgi:hypothetical protein
MSAFVEKRGYLCFLNSFVPSISVMYSNPASISFMAFSLVSARATRKRQVANHVFLIMTLLKKHFASAGSTAKLNELTRTLTLNVSLRGTQKANTHKRTKKGYATL